MIQVLARCGQSERVPELYCDLLLQERNGVGSARLELKRLGKMNARARRHEGAMASSGFGVAASATVSLAWAAWSVVVSRALPADSLAASVAVLASSPVLAVWAFTVSSVVYRDFVTVT
jgi:hypothetical protein